MVEPVILVVDDSPLIQRMLSLVLQKAGYRVETAQDGEEALAKVRSLHPSLIFLDVMMPKKDGYQVAEEIRSDDSLPRQPYIIMLSALDDKVDQGRARALGVDEFVPKPFSPTDILQRVRSVMGG